MNVRLGPELKLDSQPTGPPGSPKMTAFIDVTYKVPYEEASGSYPSAFGLRVFPLLQVGPMMLSLVFLKDSGIHPRFLSFASSLSSSSALQDQGDEKAWRASS